MVRYKYNMDAIAQIKCLTGISAVQCVFIMFGFVISSKYVMSVKLIKDRILKKSSKIQYC